MKNSSVFLKVFILVIFLTVSCSTTDNNTEIIQKIDAFKDNNKNIQLAKDLLFVKYPSLIRKAVPQLEENDLEGIQWEFIQNDAKEVLFRIKLDTRNLKIKQNREKIVLLFNDTVKDQVDFQIANQATFDSLIKKTGTFLGIIDAEKYDLFWAACSEQFMKNMPQKQILQFMQSKPERFGKLRKRSLLSKFLFRPENKDVDVYRITFKSEYDFDIIQEYISWVRDETGKWKIAAYGIRGCGQMCRGL